MSIKASNNPYPDSPDASPTKLDKGGYDGTAKTLENKIDEILVEAKLLIDNTLVGSTSVGSIVPSSVPPATGAVHAFATQAGTYTNWGGFIVPANTFAFISRSANLVFSISQTTLDVTGKVNVSDVVNTLVSTETTKPLSAAQGKALNEKIAKGIPNWVAGVYTTGDEVNHLGKDWVSNAAIISTDVPGVSSKWVERLNFKTKVFELFDNGASTFHKIGKVAEFTYAIPSNYGFGIMISQIGKLNSSTYHFKTKATTTTETPYLIRYGVKQDDRMQLLFTSKINGANITYSIWSINFAYEKNSIKIIDRNSTINVTENLIQTPIYTEIASYAAALTYLSGQGETVISENIVYTKSEADALLLNKVDKVGSDRLMTASEATAIAGGIPDNSTLIAIDKSRMSTGIESVELTTSENVAWTATGYDKRTFGVWYNIIATKTINKLLLPLRKNVANVNLTNGIVVRVAVNGVFRYKKTITLAELVAWGINTQTTSTPTANTMYSLEIPLIPLNVGDELFIAWGCIAATDTLTFQYDNNDPTGTHYANRYHFFNNTDISSYTSVPTASLPGGETWTYPVICYFVDYVAKKIQEGGVTKTTETIVTPAKIYTVCNDIIQTDSGFNSRNYAACLYVDHFLKLSSKKDIVFDSTKSDKLPIFAPIATDVANYNGGVNVKTTTVTDKLVGATINDVSLSISHISTKASITNAAFPKILVIGDSVTNAFLADKPTSITTNNPTAFWSWTKKFFELDKVDNSNIGHQSLLLGKQTSRNFIVNGNTIKSFAEGRGGWTAANYLYDNIVGAYTNFFYDGSLPTVKFSLAKYLSNYKTLADDGVTRLVVGSTAGVLVTNVNAHDVCTPTHVVIQLGFNDVEANAIANIQLMIDSIKAEFPTMIVIISSTDAAGTYYPENYPMFDSASVNLLNDALHTKMWNLCTGFKALENVGNKIFYCPNYFVQPTAWGVAFREVNFPESIANPDFIFKTEHGAGNNYHPNNYAHAAWGYQLYSLIKYTLTL